MQRQVIKDVSPMGHEVLQPVLPSVNHTTLRKACASTWGFFLNKTIKKGYFLLMASFLECIWL